MLGRFQLRKELHRGAAGEVWLARERDTREQVVVRLAYERPAVERLRRESRALARIGSAGGAPGVPRWLAHGRCPDGSYGVVEEWIDGAQLSKVLRVTSPSPSRSAGWGRQLAGALTAVHRAGVVHGDVHPDNVIVGRDANGRDRLVLIGFSLSDAPRAVPRRPIRFARAAGRVTARGRRAARSLGMIDVASPEAIRGARPRAPGDIYALGAVLYRMLADRWPFMGPAVLDDQLATPPPPLGTFAPQMRLPPGFEQIVLRCLAKDRGQRWRSAADLDAELGAVEYAPHRDWVKVGVPPPIATPVP
ncbi:MAG: serine/threonine-protein kinase, partial [Myxococcota bacterium]